MIWDGNCYRKKKEIGLEDRMAITAMIELEAWFKCTNVEDELYRLVRYECVYLAIIKTQENLYLHRQ